MHSLQLESFPRFGPTAMSLEDALSHVSCTRRGPETVGDLLANAAEPAGRGCSHACWPPVTRLAHALRSCTS